MSTTPAENDWTFGGLWPYEPRWFHTPDGRMHYVDEGPRDGKPVVMFHPNATWAFAFRNVIPPLVEAGYRAIAADMLGFGRSDKPDDAAIYGVDRHLARVEALLESLDLTDVTTLSSEWGTAVGLGWAVKHPERIGRLCLMNSPNMARPAENDRLPLPIWLFRAPGLGTLTVKRIGMFTKGFLFNASVVHKERLTPAIKEAYLAPHPDPASRTSILAFPRQLPRTPHGLVADLSDEVGQGLEAFVDRPVTIVWGDKDVSFGQDVLEKWQARFPQAEVVRLDDAGHFVLEDAHERLVPELLSLLAREDQSIRTEQQEIE